MQPGVLDGHRHQPGDRLKKGRPDRSEGPRLSGVDPYHAHDFLLHPQRYGQHRPDPLGLGRGGVLKALLARYIKKRHGFACQQPPVKRTLADLHTAFGEVMLAQAMRCHQLQPLPMPVE